MGVKGTPAPAGQETGAGPAENTKIDNRQAKQPDTGLPNQRVSDEASVGKTKPGDVTTKKE